MTLAQISVGPRGQNSASWWQRRIAAQAFGNGTDTEHKK